MNGKEQEIYTFDKFHLDVGNGVLLREGEAISLQRKSFQTLCVLVKSQGRLITRDELIDEIWPDAFVEENNLSQHIRSIRKALGDGESGNKLIETVPRRGFRFLPEVQKWDISSAGALAVADKSDLVLVSEDEIANDNRSLMIANRRHSRMWPKLVVVVAVLGSAAVLFWAYRESATEKRIQYASKIKLAAQALNASDLPLTRQLLAETTPKDGEEDLRGFEWGYSSRLHAENVASQPITFEHMSDSVAFSPDGKTLASAGMDKMVRLWNVSTGEPTMTLAGHTGWLISVAFSPDGRKIASGSFDKSARVWDAETGRELFTVHGQGKGNAIGELTFSPDGSVLAGGDGEVIRFWDSATGIEKTDYFESPEAFSEFAFSPDGKLIAARGLIKARHAIVWEIASGRKLMSFEGKADFLTDIKFSPDSKMLLTGSNDGTAQLWDMKSGKGLRIFEGHIDEIRDVAFSPDGETIATGSNDNTIKLWDTEKGHEIATLKGHSATVRALAFSPDGRKLASGSEDNTARIWNVPQSEPRGVLRGHAKEIDFLTFSLDSKTLASASEDGTVKLWDVETERDRLTISGDKPAFSPDGLTLATAGEDRKIKLWDVVTGRERLSFDSPQKATVLKFSPDAKMLASGHWFQDDYVRLWNSSDGSLACSADAGDGVWTVEFLKDGKEFVTNTGTIRFWETASCREISRFEGEPNTAYFSFLTANGKLLTLQIINNERSLKLVDIESGKELVAFSGHETKLTGADFSPDGNRLATRNESGLITIWDVTTGLELLSLKANIGEAIAFSPDGTILAAAGNDGTIRLFRANPN